MKPDISQNISILNVFDVLSVIRFFVVDAKLIIVIHVVKKILLYDDKLKIEKLPYIYYHFKHR